LGDGAGFRPWCERRVQGRRQRFLVARRRIVSSVRAEAFAMAIGPGGSWERSRLTGSAGRILPVRGQSFALDLKQAGFDRAGTTKSPQQACQPMSERKLEHGSRINTADEGTLEHSVGSNMFEILKDGLVSKPITPSAAARSVAFTLRIDTRKVRDIVLGGFGRSPHRHW
jgi:hypothetical protein